MSKLAMSLWRVFAWTITIIFSEGIAKSTLVVYVSLYAAHCHTSHTRGYFHHLVFCPAAAPICL